MQEKSKHVNKRHNVSLLMYHFVCPAKYRKIVFDDIVDQTLKEVCFEIEKRYEIWFLEIWTDKNHVHFLIQSVPDISPKNIIQMIKSITAREVLKRNPEIKRILWWWKFWTSWYYVNTVWRYWNEEVIRRYVKNQWIDKEYNKIYTKEQMILFE